MWSMVSMPMDEVKLMSWDPGLDSGIETVLDALAAALQIEHPRQEAPPGEHSRQRSPTNAKKSTWML